MAINNQVKAWAATVTALSVIGGSAVALDTRHYPMQRGEALEASAAIQAIQGWISEARQHGASPAVCQAIEGEILQLCGRIPDHYVCTDDMRRSFLERAGCSK
jgi:hypothetical protein